MGNFPFTLLPIIPLIAWLLLVAWSPNPTEGDVLLRVPVPVLARVKMLGLPFGLGVLISLVGIALGEVSWRMLPVLTVVFGITLSIPISYTLTTVGIRTGKGVFRRWTEFAGVRRSPSGATLQGGPRASSYPIFLSGGREDDEFVLTLRNLIRDSYKGQATERDRLRGGNTPNHSGGESRTTSSINH